MFVNSVHQVRGKTMMARRIPSILPDLNFEEALEITKIHSIAGELRFKGNLSIAAQGGNVFFFRFE